MARVKQRKAKYHHIMQQYAAQIQHW